MNEPNLLDEPLVSTSKPRKRKARKPKETLFEMPNGGDVGDTPQDSGVADAVVTQCESYIMLLRKIGATPRESAIRRITKALNAAQVTVNVAVFQREKEAPTGPMLL
jgi:hypothetical protein